MEAKASKNLKTSLTNKVLKLRQNLYMLKEKKVWVTTCSPHTAVAVAEDVGRDQNCTIWAGKMKWPDLNESFKTKMSFWDLYPNFQIVCYSLPDTSATDQFFPSFSKIQCPLLFFCPSLAGQERWLRLIQNPSAYSNCFSCFFHCALPVCSALP